MAGFKIKTLISITASKSWDGEEIIITINHKFATCTNYNNGDNSDFLLCPFNHPSWINTN